MQNTHETPEPELYTITAGGFSATADAFARDPETDGLWFLSIVGAQTALKAIWASLLKQPPDPAHIIKGADGMALSGGYQRCVVPKGDRRDLDDQDRPPARERRLARARLHEVGRVRLGAGQLPPARARRRRPGGAPPPLPRPAQPAPPASHLGGVALAAGDLERGDHPAAVGGHHRPRLQARRRVAAGGPLPRGRTGHPLPTGGRVG